MEMQLQELHSADMSTALAASHDPDQLISSISSSSISSSDLSSAPLDTSSSSSISTSPLIPSAPPHPPPAAPQLPHAESQHCTIAIQLSPPQDPPGRRPLSYYPTKKAALQSLRESIPHSMRLSQLHKSEWGFQKDARSHKKLMRRHSKDLFMVVSIYAVLQGALFTAVAQSSIFTCVDRWGPASKVVAVTIGTMFCALEKLRRMEYEKQEVKKSEWRQSST